MGKITSYLQYLIDFIYPKICLSCRNKLRKDIDISSKFCCEKCLNSFSIADSPAKIQNSLITEFKDTLAISNAVSLYFSVNDDDDSNIMRLIYKLKYDGFTKIGLEFGRKLGILLKNDKMIDYDYVVPVPIHSARLRERGYNQSDYIARGVRGIIGSQVATDILKRTKYTITQTQCSSILERKENIKNAFQLNPHKNVAGKKILLIDDVLTSGSTLNYCATTLLENQAKQVDVATLVKAGSR